MQEQQEYYPELEEQTEILMDPYREHQDLLDNDEISSEEAAFLQGYND